MESYRPKEITQFAKETAKAYPLNDTSMAAEYPDSVEQKIFIPKQSLEVGGREHRRAVGKYSGDVASARSAGKSDRTCQSRYSVRVCSGWNHECGSGNADSGAARNVQCKV